jgi:hypothetical protein
MLQIKIKLTMQGFTFMKNKNILKPIVGKKSLDET